MAILSNDKHVCGHAHKWVIWQPFFFIVTKTEKCFRIVSEGRAVRFGRDIFADVIFGKDVSASVFSLSFCPFLFYAPLPATSPKSTRNPHWG